MLAQDSDLISDFSECLFFLPLGTLRMLQEINFFGDLWNALHRREVAGDEDGITIVNG